MNITDAWPDEAREWNAVRRLLPVKSLARHEAGRLTDGSSAHGQPLGEMMHRQDPLLRLVAVEGDAKSVPDLEQEAVEAVLRVAEKGLTSLSGSGSPKLRYLASVQAGAMFLLAGSQASQSLLG